MIFSSRLPCQPVAFLCALLAGAVAATNSSAAAPPQRVVSLDYCADQFVLKLVARENILALSPDAAAPFSYMRDAAAGVATTRADAESVLQLQPDLVVRSYGGGPRALEFFQRLSIPVLQIPYAGDVTSIRDTMLQVARALDVEKKAINIMAIFEKQLAELPKTGTPRTGLYVTPGGVTTGPGTLVHDLMAHAGVDNFQRQPGWRTLPLERLAYEQPDLVIASFFDAKGQDLGYWSPSRHPLIRRQLKETPGVALQGAWTTCGAWFLIDAIVAIADATQTPQQ